MPVGQGLHAAGFMAYELGYAFEQSLSAIPAPQSH